MADEDAEARDPLYPVAVEIVQRTGRPSISLVQRQLRIGYNRAAELIERMEQEGLVTPMGEDGNRELVQSVFPSRPVPEAPKPQEEPGYPSNAWFGWLLALAVIGCLVAGWIDIDNLMWWLLGAALPAGAVVLGLITRCPRCGSWWAAQEVSSRVVDRYQKSKEVDRVDVTRDAAGNEIARTERRKTVTVNVEKRRESHQCNRCDFTWTEDIEYGR